MVLTAEERAELERLQAKDAEPEPDTRNLTITLAADVADVVRQLVQVHWQSIAPEVGSAFTTAVADAEAALAASEAQAAPEAADPEPAEAEGQAAPEPEAAAEPAAFGSESDPGLEPAQ